MGEFKNYANHLENKAGDVFSDHESEFKSAVLEGSADDVRAYFDQIVHEEADNAMIYCDLYDAAEILEQSDNVETDWGLWEGEAKDPREAIKTQAFYTYRNDLLEAVIETAGGFLDDYKEEAEKAVSVVEARLDHLENVIDDLKGHRDDSEDAEEIEEFEKDIEEAESDYMLAEEKLDAAQEELDNIENIIEKSY